MHACAISKILYGFASVRAIIDSLKLMAYLSVQTHKPYNTDFCMSHTKILFLEINLKNILLVYVICWIFYRVNLVTINNEKYKVLNIQSGKSNPSEIEKVI